jgi:hypothetical protein
MVSHGRYVLIPEMQIEYRLAGANLAPVTQCDARVRFRTLDSEQATGICRVLMNAQAMLQPSVQSEDYASHWGIGPRRRWAHNFLSHWPHRRKALPNRLPPLNSAIGGKFREMDIR